MKKEKVTNETIVFPSWEVSVTGDWSPETGLLDLRDRPPEDLAILLWDPGIYVQNSAIMEFIGHGNLRKAAQFTRALVVAHPIAIVSVRKYFTSIADILFYTPLESLPSSPSEYPSMANT